MKYQSRYVAYCKSNHLTPEEMLALDRKRFPGGIITEYITWITKQKTIFRQSINKTPNDGLSSQEQDNFDIFLAGLSV